ncbi:hypothetical protein J5N97_021373 [Dioscorea zingiberensis]|uniref:BZIP domain-containing protein n=1 Tax=Dioscorea zingiberensis TaxID=325984 RepID=A0A9D5HEA4_9LILI|nr:hypothetical protein J5N97_021373 [Dioscorea zingiberensis]
MAFSEEEDQQRKQEMNNSDEIQKTEQQAEEELVHSPVRQPSFYSLTLGEIQELLMFDTDKSFGSMNMDEFLASICGAEDSSQHLINGSPAPAGRRLQRQGSINIPQSLFGKTIKQVWDVLVENLKQACPEKTLPRQQSLGDMTLEDFLFKAGVFQERLPDDPTPPCQRFETMTNRSLPTCVHTASPDMLLLEPVGAGMDLLASPPSRKRFADEAVEKVVERRQRRMIKNRESAARSRARKQAYTVELELELNQLREENAHLQQEQTMVLALRRQLITQIMDNQARINAMKNIGTLRRSKSCSW